MDGGIGIGNFGDDCWVDVMNQLIKYAFIVENVHMLDVYRPKLDSEE